MKLVAHLGSNGSGDVGSKPACGVLNERNMILDDVNEFTKGSHKKIRIQCDECGKIEYRGAAHLLRTLKNNLNYSCLCKSCRRKGDKNPFFGKTRKHTEQWKKDRVEYNKTHPNPMFGKKASVETKQKISEANKKRWANKPILRKDGVYEFARKCFKYIEWRNEIFKRDNYTCIKCGDNKGGNLEADHIIPFIAILKKYKFLLNEDVYSCDELWDINNGRTLCNKCHKETDTYGNKAKNFKLEE